VTLTRRFPAMAGQSMSGEQLREISRLWWLPLSLGVLSIIAGVIVLAKPSNSLATLAVVAGIFVLVDGIFELGASLSSHTENRGLIALLGTVNLIVGVFLIRHPIKGVTAVALLLGIWLIAMGAVRFVQSFETEGHRTWRLVVAIVELIAGVVIVASPSIGYKTLALLVGFAFIINGLSMSVLGLAMRTTKDADGGVVAQ
jgi:uncharacterized membrane protein HdeD (DUF308 family)